MGFCSMHNRKRMRSDLVPWDEQSDRMRCNPRRECRLRDPVQLVTCHLHSRKRNITQMKEVRPGVWECLPNLLCRQYGNGPSGRPVTGPPPGGSFAPYDRPPRSGPRGGVEYGRERYDSVAAATWAPTGGPGGPLDEARPRPRFPRREPGMAERRVLCARHGKSLYMSMCESVQDCCYTCLDSSTCLSTPLEVPTELAEKREVELLCAKHNTLRAAAFMVLNTEKNGYQCQTCHPCRGVTLTTAEVAVQPLMHSAAGEDAAVEEFGQGYLGPARGVPTGMGQPLRKEAVSSFFV